MIGAPRAWPSGRTAEKHFEGEFPVVMSGGLLPPFPNMPRRCESWAARARMIRARSPVYGAAVEAMWDAGYEPGESFKAQFLKSYNSLAGKSK